MSSTKQLTRLKSKIPRGKKLPAGFKAFLSARLPLSISWTSLEPYGLTKSAEQEMVPFIHIADGSLVSLWLSVDPPAVVLRTRKFVWVVVAHPLVPADVRRYPTESRKSRSARISFRVCGVG